MNKRKILMWVAFAAAILGLFMVGPLLSLFKTPEPFVTTGPPEAELKTSADFLPREQLLDMIYASFTPTNDLEVFKTRREATALLESWKNAETGSYDIRALFKRLGDIELPPNATAQWDPITECAIFQFDPELTEFAPILLKPERQIYESDLPRIKISAHLVMVKMDASQPFSVEPVRTDIESLREMEGSLQFLDRVEIITKSGQRAKAESGATEMERRDSEGKLRDPAVKFRSFEIEPALGGDYVTVDLNFAYETHNPEADPPYYFNMTTQITMYAGRELVSEIGTTFAEDGTAYRAFLVVCADRIGRAGLRWMPEKTYSQDSK